MLKLSLTGWARLLVAGGLLGLLASPAAANPSECAALEGNYEQTKAGLVELEVNNFMFKAADKGCLTLMARLLDNGGSVIMRQRGGETALHHAAMSGKTEVAKLLLKKGADINQRDLKGSTPLYLAAESNQPEMVAFLLDHKADAAIEGRTEVTPLAAAAYNGSEKIVEALLAHGVDAKAPDRTGKAAILYAANRGFQPVVERLLKAGVDVNAVYANNLTVLMWAAGFSDDVPEDDAVKLVTLLLDKGAKPDLQDDRGYTALMAAAELGHTGVVKLLAMRGADKALKSKEGKTAVDLATAVELKAILAGH